MFEKYISTILLLDGYELSGWFNIEESLKNDEESQHLFLIALRNVVEAQGGMGNLAKKAHAGRESLCKELSEKDSPKWHTLVSLFIALGLNFRLNK
jgi:DNA-binding phage protein